MKSGTQIHKLLEKLLTCWGNEGFEKTIINIKNIILSSINLVKKNKISSIKWDVNINNGIPDLMGNEDHLTQVFLNLLINAMDAIDEKGYISIKLIKKFIDYNEAKLFYNTCPGNYIYIEIENSGTGISQENQSKIFEPFFTTKKTNNKKGSGLGLYHSLGIINQHNGRIRVKSSENGPTVFYLIFPTKKIEESTLTKRSINIVNNDTKDFVTNYKTIVIYEPDVISKILLENYFKNKNVRLIIEENIENLFRIIDNIKNDIGMIIANIESEEELIKQLNKNFLKIPIIFSGCSRHSTYDFSNFDNGKILYLEKPIDFSKLSNLLKILQNKVF